MFHFAQDPATQYSAHRAGCNNHSKHPPHVCDLPGQCDHLAQRTIIARLRLCKLHVCTLQALVEHVHDFGSYVTDIGVLLILSVHSIDLIVWMQKTYGSVDVRHDGAEPFKTQFHVGLEARRDGS